MCITCVYHINEGRITNMISHKNLYSYGIVFWISLLSNIRTEIYLA